MSSLEKGCNNERQSFRKARHMRSAKHEAERHDVGVVLTLLKLISQGEDLCATTKLKPFSYFKISLTEYI